MKKLLLIILLFVGVSTQAQQSKLFFTEYEKILVETQSKSITDYITHMVELDDSRLSREQKVYRHSKMVLSRKNVRKITRQVLDAMPKPEYEHKPHEFKQRGFGNTNHNAPGHVCDETCHQNK